MFILTNGTATRSAQPSPFLERETALLAKGRFHSKAFGMDRSFNMREMIEGISFFDPEQLRNLP
jgi:hypothetical protein